MRWVVWVDSSLGWYAEEEFEAEADAEEYAKSSKITFPRFVLPYGRIPIGRKMTP